MPARDKINAKANEWIKDAGKVAPARKEVGKTGRKMSAQIQRLARRLDCDPDELSERIPDDTLRRTKYPVTETVNEDGTRCFKHNPF
jgi:hypothetical protein